MTRSRSRQQPLVVHRYSSTNTLQSSPVTGFHKSEWIEEHRVKPKTSNIRHHKCIQPANGYFGTFFDVRHVWENACLPLDGSFPVSFLDTKERFYSRVLAGPADNNDFELLTFAADIDDTIAMFSRKFLRDLSYGSITWGVLPFVSDLRGLIQSLQDVNTGLARYPRCERIHRRTKWSQQWKFDDTFYYGQNFTLQSLDALIRANGVLTFNPPDLTTPLNKAKFLLDELGVHPDLKTAWDVIPLSFVLDYFLPIGDLLESLHPRGWGSYTYTFEGFLTVSGLYETAYAVHPWGQPPSVFQPALWSFYEREFRKGSEGVPLPIEFKAPSLKELFNVGYLQGLLRPLESGLKSAFTSGRR